MLLATHFGFNRARRWALAGNFYCQLGADEMWTWQAARADHAGLHAWLRDQEAVLNCACVSCCRCWSWPWLPVTA